MLGTLGSFRWRLKSLALRRRFSPPCFSPPCFVDCAGLAVTWPAGKPFGESSFGPDGFDDEYRLRWLHLELPLRVSAVVARDAHVATGVSDVNSGD